MMLQGTARLQSEYFLHLLTEAFSLYFSGELGKAPEAVVDSLPAEPMGATAGPSYAEEEEEEDMSAMQARLEALRS